MVQKSGESLRSEGGTTAIEYGLTAGLVASAAIAMLVLLKGDLGSLFAALGLH